MRYARACTHTRTRAPSQCPRQPLLTSPPSGGSHLALNASLNMLTSLEVRHHMRARVCVCDRACRVTDPAVCACAFASPFSLTSLQIGYTSWCRSRDFSLPVPVSVPLLLIDERLSSSAAAAALASSAAAAAAAFARPPRTSAKRPVAGHKHAGHRHNAAAAAAAAAAADGSSSVDAASAAWILEAAVMGIIGRKGLHSSSEA